MDTTDTRELIEQRHELHHFANSMEVVLQNNDHKEHWSNYSAEWLYGRLLDEVSELYAALQEADPEDIEQECIDVANFAMMIADHQRIKP